MSRTMRRGDGDGKDPESTAEDRTDKGAKGKRSKRGRRGKKRLAQQLQERARGGGARPKGGGRKGGGNWIQGAIGKPGQLHRDLGVPEGQKIPAAKLKAALDGKYGPKVKRRAELARTLSGFRKG